MTRYLPTDARTITSRGKVRTVILFTMKDYDIYHNSQYNRIILLLMISSSPKKRFVTRHSNTEEPLIYARDPACYWPLKRTAAETRNRKKNKPESFSLWFHVSAVPRLCKKGLDTDLSLLLIMRRTHVRERDDLARGTGLLPPSALAQRGQALSLERWGREGMSSLCVRTVSPFSAGAFLVTGRLIILLDLSGAGATGHGLTSLEIPLYLYKYGVKHSRFIRNLSRIKHELPKDADFFLPPFVYHCTADDFGSQYEKPTSQSTPSQDASGSSERGISTPVPRVTAAICYGAPETVMGIHRTLLFLFLCGGGSWFALPLHQHPFIQRFLS
ncbi:unnamed protein product [Larinioides sclopetarius]|uniref:Cytochrome c biogenesis FC n=1 Tax=Larinioides sclopetarius TaxID=280406 RepID=A0AAV1Z5K3_9ARAC